MSTGARLRPASIQDSTGISLLLNSSAVVHRHLDWRSPLDWLSCSPFWVQEEEKRITALLAMPAEPPHVSWVRLFAAETNPMHAWKDLFAQCLTQSIRSSNTLAALSFAEWFSHLLLAVGFTHHQNVVGLAWDNLLPAQPSLPREVTIRSMHAEDLSRVKTIDALAFEPIWQNSLAEIERAFGMDGFCSVAEYNGEVVGFQISTFSINHLHLARLAVDPALQRLSIASGLVYHLQNFCQREHLAHLTVNTQSNNRASLSLYRKFHFHLTGDDIPVFIFQ